METEHWILLWTIFFFASLGIFALLAVSVTIGGFFELRVFFKSLAEDRSEDDSDAGGGDAREKRA